MDIQSQLCTIMGYIPRRQATMERRTRQEGHMERTRPEEPIEGPKSFVDQCQSGLHFSLSLIHSSCVCVPAQRYPLSHVGVLNT